MAPMVETIARAQASASEDERAAWKGKDYSTVSLGGVSIVLYKSRLLVPQQAGAIKDTLLRMAHDDNAHYMGAQRTLIHLHTQARVHWENMHVDVQKFVNSCHRCQFAKAEAHGKQLVGKLSPTIAPSVHHTWYVDMKGPMPHGTGYLMAVVESITRMVKLRYVSSVDSASVEAALADVIDDFGTRPMVLRTDGGAPFDSVSFSRFCEKEGIQVKIGMPHHSQGQGTVETRFRGVAASIMAVLGHKAPHLWLSGPLLSKLERLMNETFCESIHGSPYWAMYGREPRTRLAAMVDWSSPSFGEVALGLPEATYNDYMEVVAQHHATMNAVQGRVMLASSVAQALTKRAWDASRTGGDYVVGDFVLVLHTAPNKMLPHFKGPYRVTEVSADGNFVVASHFQDSAVRRTNDGPFHVSRLVRFDATRVSARELDEFLNYRVSACVGHRYVDDGSLEMHVRWEGTDITTWESYSGVSNARPVIDYVLEQGLFGKPRSAATVGSVMNAVRSAESASSHVAGGAGRAVSKPAAVIVDAVRAAESAVERVASTRVGGRGGARGGLGRGAAMAARSGRDPASAATAAGSRMGASSLPTATAVGVVSAPKAGATAPADGKDDASRKSARIKLRDVARGEGHS